MEEEKTVLKLAHSASLCYHSALQYSNTRRNPPMRCKVQLFVAGKVFDEIVEAKDYQDARRTALARNPSAKVIGVTAVFG
jgi:hypothetical protein